MSRDSLLPPGNSSDDEDAAEDADEAAAASALARALEGRSGAAQLPDAALETAALLRYSRGGAELSEERRAVLRQQVLASLPSAATGSSQASSPHRSLWRWLGLAMPLAGAAAAVWLVVGAFERAAEPELARRADERAGATPERAAAPRDDTAAEQPTTKYEIARNEAEADEAEKKQTAAPRAARGMTAPQTTDEAEAAPGGARERRGAAADELRAPPAEAAPGALASRIAAAPSAPSTAGGNSRAQASQARGAGSIGAGAGLRATEAKRSAAPSSERLERSSQRLRARLQPKLGDARLDHAYAELDRAQTNAELRQARTSLTALASGALGSAGDTSDAALLRQDLFCRLAEVALRLGQPDVALDWAQRGLALQAPPSPFEARLWLVEGKARAALGDPDGAAKSYMKAIEVNERLLDESLDGAE